MNEIEICTLNSFKWVLGEEAPKPMNWYDAKAWCKSINQELPSREVLLMAYLNPETKNHFAVDSYWGSTESDSGYAWFQYFDTGNQYDYYTDIPNRVRAVRAIRVGEPS